MTDPVNEEEYLDIEDVEGVEIEVVDPSMETDDIFGENYKYDCDELNSTDDPKIEVVNNAASDPAKDDNLNQNQTNPSATEFDEALSSLIDKNITTDENELQKWKEVFEGREDCQFGIEDEKKLEAAVKKFTTNPFPPLPPTSSKSSKSSRPLPISFSETPFDSIINDKKKSKQESQRNKNDKKFFSNVTALSSLYLRENSFDAEIPCVMAMLKLFLGDKYEDYETTMQEWFSGELDRVSYVEKIRDTVPKEALQFHNELIYHILKKSFHYSQSENCETCSDKVDLAALYTYFSTDKSPESPANPSDGASTSDTSVALTNATTSFKVEPQDDDDDDDDEVVMIKKSKKKKRKRILDDDDEEETITNNVIKRPSYSETPNTETFNHLRKKKKRKMVISSDEEDELSSIFDTGSSSSNAIVDDEPKTIDVKSTGLLKTTLTINRNSLRDSINANSYKQPKSSSSLLDQLLSSNTPISLLPNSSSECRSKVPSSSSSASLSSSNINAPSASSDEIRNKKGIRIQNSPVVGGATMENSIKNTTNLKMNSSISATLNPSSSKNNRTILLKSGSASKVIQSLTSKNQADVNLNKHSAKRLNSHLTNNSASSSNSNSSDSASFANDNDHPNKATTTRQSNKGNNSHSLLSRKVNSVSKSIVRSKINLNSTANATKNSSALSASHRGKLSALESLLSSTNGTRVDEPVYNGNDNHGQNQNHSLFKKPTSTVRYKSNQQTTTICEANHSANIDELPLHSSKNTSSSTYQSNGIKAKPERYDVMHFQQFDQVLRQYAMNQINSLDVSLEERDEDDGFPFVHNQGPIDDGKVVHVRRMASYERANIKTRCDRDVCLPENSQLRMRITDIAARYGLDGADRSVVPFCNSRLRDFMRNIISKYITTRSTFSMHANQIQHHIGAPVANPYLFTSYRTLARLPTRNNSIESSSILSNGTDSLNGNLYRNYECGITPPGQLDSELRPKKYGIEKNMLTFSRCDHASINKSSTGESSVVTTPYRPSSGCLHVAGERPVSSEGSLRHLLNVLKTEKSLVPVHKVLASAIYRTISAINNTEEETPNEDTEK